MLFAKLFRSQYDSSIANNYLVRWVFNDLIILSDMEGFVDMTYESIARVTGVPLDIVKDSIAALMADDPMSRSKEHNGRRLIPMLDDEGKPRPWGWQIVNKPYYMKIKDAETMRERNRLRQARHRVTKKRDKSVTVTLSNAASHHVTPNKNENKREIEKENERGSIPAAGAARGPAHTSIFKEEADRAGVVVAFMKPDVVGLARVLKELGDEDHYRNVCALYFKSTDNFIIENGFSGRFLLSKLQAILNYEKQAAPARPTKPAEKTEFQKQWDSERAEMLRRLKGEASAQS